MAEQIPSELEANERGNINPIASAKCSGILCHQRYSRRSPWTNLNPLYTTATNRPDNNTIDVSGKLLKAIKYETSKAITHIINLSLHTGIFPDKLKLAKVIPVFKKGDRTKLDNYRPISILPAISKIFERAIFDQLYIHFTHNNLFYESQ